MKSPEHTLYTELRLEDLQKCQIVSFSPNSAGTGGAVQSNEHRISSKK